MAQTAYRVPLIAASQTLAIVLSGTTYNLRVLWNDAAYCWVLDIYDTANNPVVLGIAIVTGVDLLGQFKYLKFGGQLVAQTSSDTLAIPTYDNLGADGNLYFVVTD